MPPERKRKPSILAGATADCVLPEDIITACILTRLPVKSIFRFKSVCKPWRHLFSTPEFIKTHRGLISNDPKNQSVFIHAGFVNYFDHTLSLLNTESNEKMLTVLNLPYPNLHYDGCFNGLFCMSNEGQIVLWNPVMKLFKFVNLPEIDYGDLIPMMDSQGFGYDAEEDDFKVVMIFSVEYWNSEEGISIGGVGVYSVNSDSWTKIEPGFQFRVIWRSSEVIVNGNPYWLAELDDDGLVVLVRFDMKKYVFNIVPLPTFYDMDNEKQKLVDWNGTLGVLVCILDDEAVNWLEVWVFDDSKQIWRNNHTFGPIQGSVHRIWLCLKNGIILGERPDSKVFVFDPENGCVKDIVIDETRRHAFDIYEYNESLTHIKGMNQV